MPHRYIALVWNTAVVDTNSIAKNLIWRLESAQTAWHVVLAAKGLRVYEADARAESAQAYLLDRTAGVVLGRIFDRRKLNRNCRQAAFGRRETQEILRSGGRHLIEHYWGRYVAFLREAGAVHVRVLRDPTGAMPGFAIKYSGINIICSHISDCAKLGLVNSTINWDHIAAYLWSRRLVTRHTGLDDVQQIQAGECMAIGLETTSSSFYWNPAMVHDQRLLEDRAQAMHELRTVVQQCVTSWAACYSRILHELSGGLDSSVVLACLSESSVGANIVCENFFTQGAQGDERFFANKAASLSGVRLIETPLRSRDVRFEQLFDSTRVATPALSNLLPEYQSNRERLIKASGIDAVFSGQGGDHCFLRTASRLIAAEYVWRHGVKRGLSRVVLDTSRFTRTPIWSVVAKAVTSGLLRRYDDPYELSPPPLVSEAAWRALDSSSIRHPWLEDAKHLPESKLIQILNIVDSQNFYRIPALHAEIVHPLISQPIIELCLQIPSYVLSYNGIDRALVRDAFSDIVPSEITKRTVKGATTGYVHRLLVTNLPFLRDLLLGGLLIERVLDRAKTEAALSEAALVREPHLLFPVLSAIQAEAWLRTWTSDGHRAAA